MRRLPLVLTAGLAVVALTACGSDDLAGRPTTGETTVGSGGATATSPGGTADVTTPLVGPDGEELGTVEMTAVDGGTQVSVEVSGLEPGFKGFHVHEVGLCEPDSASPSDPTMTGDFMSAGGHVGVGESDHGEHVGDLPSLRVTEAGDASLTTVTDAFTPEDLLDDDGSAVMVHSGADNFANVPERYAPDGPDQDTLDTGDSGSRVACAVVE